MRFPERGTDADLVARLVRFVDARRPGWSSRIRGASEPEITALERLVAPDFRFPAAFRGTLAAFGHEDDERLAKVQGTHGRHRSVAALTSRYNDPLAFLDAFAQEHGLENAWFGDAKHRYLERDDCSLWVSLMHGIALDGYGEPAIAREHRRGRALSRNRLRLPATISAPRSAGS